MILPQFAHAHNLFHDAFLLALNIDCLHYMSRGVSYVVLTGRRKPCIVFYKMSRLLSFSSNSSSCRHIFNCLQQSIQNNFLKITPTPAGSDHRKFVDTFGRTLYTLSDRGVTLTFRFGNDHRRLLILLIFGVSDQE